jgi:hypothetical protein
MQKGKMIQAFIRLITGTEIIYNFQANFQSTGMLPVQPFQRVFFKNKLFFQCFLPPIMHPIYSWRFPR